MIANWLFYNGVQYRYEERYQHRTADEEHRQYKPDFYYPELDLYHEHFALDAQGIPPPDFEGYWEGVLWKRQTHKELGTSLFETTSHGPVSYTHLDVYKRQGSVCRRDASLCADGGRRGAAARREGPWHDAVPGIHQGGRASGNAHCDSVAGQ